MRRDHVAVGNRRLAEAREWIRRGRITDARRSYERAISAFKAADDRPAVALASIACAEALRAENPDDALWLLTSAIEAVAGMHEHHAIVAEALFLQERILEAVDDPSAVRVKAEVLALLADYGAE